MTSFQHSGAKSHDRLFRWCLALFPLVALGAYFFAWRSAPILQPDSPGYQIVARDLITNWWPSQLHVRTPGYPFLLVLTGSSFIPTRWLFLASLLMYIAAVYAGILLLRRVHFPLWAEVLFCALSLLPPFVEHTVFVLSETMTGFFLVLAVWLVACLRHPGRTGIAGGLAIGFAALTRPDFQLLGFAVGLSLLLVGQRRRALGVLVGSVLLVGALVVYNGLRFDHFGLAPTAGLNLGSRTAVFFEQIPDPRLRKVLVESRNIGIMKADELSQVTGLRGEQLDSYLFVVYLKLIISHPFLYLNEVGKASITYWFPASGRVASGGSQLIQRVWSVVHLSMTILFWLQLMTIVGTSLTHGLKNPMKHTLLVYAVGISVIFYTMLISCFIGVGDPRYRVPTDLLILLITFIGCRVWYVERFGRSVREEIA